MKKNLLVFSLLAFSFSLSQAQPLPVPKGGIGVRTLTGLAIGNGIAPFTGLAGLGDTTKFLGSDLLWHTAGGGGGLVNWIDSLNTSAPNTPTNVVALIAKGSATNIDAVIQPKDSGAFIVGNIPNNAASGGNKRGAFANDHQMKRSNKAQVASAAYSSIGGGQRNEADGFQSTISGGYGNMILGNGFGDNSFIGGGSQNKSKQLNTVIGGGQTNTIGGGGFSANFGDLSSILGGQNNKVESDSSAVGGGANNIVGIKSPYSVIVGGANLLLDSCAGSFGFNGTNASDGALPKNYAEMAISPGFPHIALFAGVDLWLANNDSIAHAIKLFSPYQNINGGFPYDVGGHNDTAFYTSFKAGLQTKNINYTLPLHDATVPGQVLSSNGAGSLSWVSAGMANPMTTTGDIIYSSDNSGTPARLGVGSANQVLKVNPASGTAIWADPSVAQIADGTSVGGNARLGTDFQVHRTAANQVAKSYGSAILGGENNRNELTNSTIAGGGNNTMINTFVDYDFIGGGQSNSIDGSAYCSILGGVADSIYSGSARVAILGSHLSLGNCLDVVACNTDRFNTVYANNLSKSVFLNTRNVILSNMDNTAATLYFLAPNTTSPIDLTLARVGFHAGAVTASVNYQLPLADGTSGQVWTTNGSGVISWTTIAGGGSGTVTTLSVVTANGISGSVANPTTTPAITLSLGAITPSSVAASGTVTGSNLSGTNTGDQTITLTGDVTGSGTGSFAATIGANKVTTSTINAAAVTYAKIQNVSANSVLLGSSATGIGAPPSEITLGSNLSMSGSTLNASGGMAIGGAIAGGTASEILFVDGSNNLGQSSNFKYNVSASEMTLNAANKAGVYGPDYLFLAGGVGQNYTIYAGVHYLEWHDYVNSFNFRLYPSQTSTTSWNMTLPDSVGLVGQVLTNLGSGFTTWTTPAVGGSGTVTSVGLSLPAEFTLSGTPVTTTGTLTGVWATQTTNKFFAAPNGSTGTPTFRAIVAADVPTLNQNTTGSAATLTTARTINGTSFDGSANITVTADANTLTNTTLHSTVVSSSLTSVGTIGTGTWQGTKIAEIYGGTNQSAYTTGDVLYASASNTLSKLAIGTTNQVLTVIGGLPSWQTASGGGVTSITGTANQVIASASTGAVTLSTPQDIATSSAPQFARLGIGRAADGTCPLFTDISGIGINNIAQTIQTFQHSSGTPGASFGSEIVVNLDDASSASAVAGRLRIRWLDPTAGAPKAEFRVVLANGGGGTANALVLANNGIGTFANSVIANTSLGASTAPTAGGHYKDNVIVAWGDIAANGTINQQFGNFSITHTANSGIYTISIPNALNNGAIITASLNNIFGFISTNAASSVSFTVNIGLGTLALPVATDEPFYFFITGRP